MPNAAQLVSEPIDELSRHQGKILHELISEQVTHALGNPANLLEVQVKMVWDDHYRVNVLTGPHLGNAQVAHSFFVVTDSNGNLLDSTAHREALLGGIRT